MGELPVVINAKVIVCSDRAYEGVYPDESGALAHRWLKDAGYDSLGVTVIPDNEEKLHEVLTNFLPQVDLIVISGGTGLGPRDITPQFLHHFTDYEVAGFGELMRRESCKFSANAYLSRCGAWVKEQKLIVALPGNKRAVEEQLDIVADILPHAVMSLKGECRHRHS